MYRLITKEQRQNTRAGWIGQNTTEKYKDIEILSTTKVIDNKERFTLAIWRGTAAKPYVTYWLRNAEQRQDCINQAKKQADARE